MCVATFSLSEFIFYNIFVEVGTILHSDVRIYCINSDFLKPFQESSDVKIRIM